MPFTRDKKLQQVGTVASVRIIAIVNRVTSSWASRVKSNIYIEPTGYYDACFTTIAVDFFFSIRFTAFLLLFQIAGLSADPDT